MPFYIVHNEPRPYGPGYVRRYGNYARRLPTRSPYVRGRLVRYRGFHYRAMTAAERRNLARANTIYGQLRRHMGRYRSIRGFSPRFNPYRR